MRTDPEPRGKSRARLAVAAVAALALTFGVAACGDDEDSDTTAAETTESTTESTTADTGSAESVSVTTTNDGDGFTWDVEPIPTADTKTVTFNNESDEFHVLIFARLSEGVTVDEALEAEGEKGTVTEVIKGGEAPPGETVEVEVTEDLTAGEYVMLCPISGPNGPHTELGQLEEFSIE